MNATSTTSMTLILSALLCGCGIQSTAALSPTEPAPGGTLGALRPEISLTLQGVPDQATLAARLNGVAASGGTPAVPGLNQMLTAVAALPATTQAYAPKVQFITQAKPAAAASPDCQAVLVTTSGVAPSPVVPTTVQPVRLMFNRSSLYLEGFARGTQYYYFKDTTDCAKVWPAGKSTAFSFPSTHASSQYPTDYSSVSKAVEALGQSGTAIPDVEKRLDQLSFVTSEALRFASAMDAVKAGSMVGKTLNPEVNSWSAASKAYDTLVRTAALPSPAPAQDVLDALKVLSTAQHQ